MNNINFFDDSKLRGQEPTLKEYIFIRKIKDDRKEGVIDCDETRREINRNTGRVTFRFDCPIDVIEDMLRHTEAYN